MSQDGKHQANPMSKWSVRAFDVLPMMAIGVFAAGCGDMVCILPPRPAIKAEIRDSVTGVGAAFNASLVVTNETVYDSSFFDSNFFGGAPGITPDSTAYSSVFSASSGKPGIYTVRVRRAGYRLWERTNIRVGGDHCGADATEVLVRLQRTR